MLMLGAYITWNIYDTPHIVFLFIFFRKDQFMGFFSLLIDYSMITLKIVFLI